MNKKVEYIINVVSLTITLASSVVVIILSFFENARTNDLIRLLGIGIVSLCVFALEKEKNKKKRHEQK